MIEKLASDMMYSLINVHCCVSLEEFIELLLYRIQAHRVGTGIPETLLRQIYRAVVRPTLGARRLI